MPARSCEGSSIGWKQLEKRPKEVIMMFCFRARKKLIPYIEGTLDQSYSEALARHIARCPKCAEELALIQSASSAFRNAKTPAMEPAADLWSRIEREITTSQPVPVARPRTVWNLQFGGAAVAAMILLFAVVNIGRFGSKMLYPTDGNTEQVKVTKNSPAKSGHKGVLNNLNIRDSGHKEPDSPTAAVVEEKNNIVTSNSDTIQLGKPKNTRNFTIVPSAPMTADNDAEIPKIDKKVIESNVYKDEEEAPVDRNDIMADVPLGNPSGSSVEHSYGAHRSLSGPAGPAGPNIVSAGSSMNKLGSYDGPGRTGYGEFAEDDRRPETGSELFMEGMLCDSGISEDIELGALSKSLLEPGKMICYRFHIADHTLTSVDLLNSTDDMMRNSALFSYP
jgi:hypothetical protein